MKIEGYECREKEKARKKRTKQKTYIYIIAHRTYQPNIAYAAYLYSMPTIF